MNFSFDILSGSIFRPFISMCLRSYYIGTLKIANSFDERIFLFKFFFHKPNTSNKNQPYSKPWISFLFSGMDKMNWWLFRNESNALLFQSNWIRAQCTHILFALTLTPIDINTIETNVFVWLVVIVVVFVVSHNVVIRCDVLFHSFRWLALKLFAFSNHPRNWYEVHTF